MDHVEPFLTDNSRVLTQAAIYRSIQALKRQKGSTKRVFLAVCRTGCSFFAHSWKLPAYSGAFLLTVDNFSFFAHSWSFSAYSFSFSTYS